MDRKAMDETRTRIRAGMEALANAGQVTDNLFSFIGAVDTTSRIMALAAQRAIKKADGQGNIRSAFIDACKEINRTYLVYYRKFREELAGEIARSAEMDMRGVNLDKPAQTMALRLIETAQQFRNSAVPLDEEKIAEVFTAILKVHVKPEYRAAAERKEYFDENEEISLFLTELDKETALYHDIVLLEEHVGTLPVSDAAKRYLLDVLWGERHAGEDIHVKIERVMSGLIQPVAARKREQMWAAFGVDPEGLSRKSRRINLQWWTGFVSRNVSNILRHEKDHLFAHLRTMLATPEGKNVLERKAKEEGTLLEWLDERLQFRFSCYPALIVVDRKAVNDAAHKIFDEGKEPESKPNP